MMLTPPQVGADFAGYRLVAVLARGGMSVVYRAENPRLGNAVALKVLAPELSSNDVFRARFLQESRVAASLNHPNVIPVYDAGPCDGLLYIAMRLVTGADLRTVLKAHGPISPGYALVLLGQAGRALDAAHRHELVHRDVKPANILIERGADEDDADHVYLGDFGITKHMLSRSGLTATGQFVGTLDYIAPEQIRDKSIDGRADIYSLGCVLYECITGRVPFVKEIDAALIWAHVEEMPTPPSAVRPELPPAIDQVIARAVAKHPDDRYSTCRELIAAACAALEVDGRTSGARGPAAKAVADAETFPAGAHGPGAISPAGHAGSEWSGSAGRASRPRVGADGAPAPDSPSPSEPPGAEGAGRPQRGRRMRSRRVLAAASVAALALAAGAVALFSSGGGHARSTRAARRHESALLQAVRNLDHSPATKGKLPVASCTARGPSLVTCRHPAYAADTVTLRTFPSLNSLYDAYTYSVKSLSEGHRLRTNFGDCLPNRTYGEVSWNHDYQHPRVYSLKQSRSGKLMDNEAAGRVFCSFDNSEYQIVWTMNDGRLLGMVAGTPHDDTWRWWRAIHHNLALPGSQGGMGTEMTAGSAMRS